ncbi:unnamed protein product, partial [marine sediment metagenome]
TLSRRAVITDLQCDPASRVAEHVSLADRSSALIVAPATANMIGKMASGIADDILSTTVLSFSGPVFIAPAMNTVMWQHPVVQRNAAALRELGCRIIGPESGTLADGREGTGRMAPPAAIAEEVLRVVNGG